jgi:hypothetical protein
VTPLTLPAQARRAPRWSVCTVARRHRALCLTWPSFNVLRAAAVWAASCSKQHRAIFDKQVPFAHSVMHHDVMGPCSDQSGRDADLHGAAKLGCLPSPGPSWAGCVAPRTLSLRSLETELGVLPRDTTMDTLSSHSSVRAVTSLARTSRAHGPLGIRVRARARANIRECRSYSRTRTNDRTTAAIARSTPQRI